MILRGVWSSFAEMERAFSRLWRLHFVMPWKRLNNQQPTDALERVNSEKTNPYEEKVISDQENAPWHRSLKRILPNSFCFIGCQIIFSADVLHSLLGVILALKTFNGIKVITNKGENSLMLSKTTNPKYCLPKYFQTTHENMNVRI